MFSGEVLAVKDLNYWRNVLPDAQFVNLYGPTEITCNCSYYIVDRTFTEEETLPIGVAFKNTGLFLLEQEENILIEGNTVTLLDPDMAIDLGGIAKGYMADQLKEYLLNEGVQSALIDLGGNILAVGSKPDNSNYTIGIKKPFEDDEMIATESINDISVVTSGCYERYFKISDTLYHHILDTKTGYPINNGLWSVTILSDSSMEGDAYSTICICLGFDDALKLIEKTEGMEALFITEDMKLYYSSGFPRD